MNEKIKQFINKHEKILIISGAGVSTESGILDFRSQEGLFQSEFERVNPQTILSIRYFRKNPARFYRFLDEKLNVDAKPNISHRFAKELDDVGKLAGVITQNIDGLYQKAGLDDSKLCEVHGNTQMVCCKCGKAQKRSDLVMSRSNNYKSSCHPTFIARPNVLLYGEFYSDGVLSKVKKLKDSCDSIILMGTRADIALIRRILSESGKQVLVINREDPALYDSLDYEFVEGSFAELLGKKEIDEPGEGIIGVGEVIGGLTDRQREDLDEMLESPDLLWYIRNKVDILTEVADKGNMSEKLGGAIELLEWLERLDVENQGE